MTGLTSTLTRTRWLARQKPQRAPSSIRVLIVDDEEAVRSFADRALRTAGFQTTVASDGPEALDLAAKLGALDLLLTDLLMPGLRGDELARRLRATQPDLKVLYFTGFSEHLFGERRTLWEDEAFLDKPATVNGLLEAVSLLCFNHL